jgi:hypothetical protein
MASHCSVDCLLSQPFLIMLKEWPHEYHNNVSITVLTVSLDLNLFLTGYLGDSIPYSDICSLACNGRSTVDHRLQCNLKRGYLPHDMSSKGSYICPDGCFYSTMWIVVRPSMWVTCVVDSIMREIAASVNSINGSNWQLVCNQWQNSRCMALYSKTALPGKPYEIGHMYVNIFLLRMTGTVTSQNIDLSSWDTLYIYLYIVVYVS